MKPPACLQFLPNIVLLLTSCLQVVCMASYRDLYSRVFNHRIPGPPTAPPLPRHTASTSSPSSVLLTSSSSSSLSPQRRLVLPSVAELYSESMARYQSVQPVNPVHNNQHSASYTEQPGAAFPNGQQSPSYNDQPGHTSAGGQHVSSHHSGQQSQTSLDAQHVTILDNQRVHLFPGDQHAQPVRVQPDLPKSALAVLNGDPDYTMFRQAFLRQLCRRLLEGANADAFQFCFSILSFARFNNPGLGPPGVQR